MATLYNQILYFFRFDHLKNYELQHVAQQFSEFAWGVDAMLEDGPEKTVALRKILEAKDAAVRAKLWEIDERPIGLVDVPLPEVNTDAD